MEEYHRRVFSQYKSGKVRDTWPSEELDDYRVLTQCESAKVKNEYNMQYQQY